MLASAFFREQKCLLGQPLLKSSNYGKNIFDKGFRASKLLMNIKTVIHKN